MKKNGEHVVFGMTSLYDGIVQQAERYGDKPRYIYKVNKQEKTFSFRDMKDHVDVIAAGLASLDMAGKFVGVTGETHPDYVAAYLATVSAGGVIVPLDKDILNEQFVGFCKRCDIAVLFYTRAMHQKMLDTAPELPDVKYFIGFDLPEDAEMPERFMRFEAFFEIGKKAYEDGVRPAETTEQDPEKLCTILFTSGTTGTSKGVMLNQRNLVTSALDSCHIMATNDKDFFVSVLPIHHAYEFTCAQLALPNCGATTYINDSIKNTMRNFVKVKPRSLVLVPLYIETMHKRIWAEIEKKGKTEQVKAAIKVSNGLRKVGVDLRRVFFKDILAAFGGEIRYIVCGGAPLRPELIDEFEAFGISIFEGYGITECAPLVSANPMHWRKHRSAGQTVEHMEARIDKADPEDTTGEIVVHGDAVMMGYYKNPEATAEVFTEDGWFRTGDIGYIDDDNFIFITGRKKNIILLSNGKNVFPEELEEYLNASDSVCEGVVIGRKNEETGEIAITALVYPNGEKFAGMTREEIYPIIKDEITEINKKLPAFKHITELELRDEEFEKTTSRKIMRYKLK